MRWKRIRPSDLVYPIEEKSEKYKYVVKEILKYYIDYEINVKKYPLYVPPRLMIYIMYHQDKNNRKYLNQYFNLHYLIYRYENKKRWKPFEKSTGYEKPYWKAFETILKPRISKEAYL